MEVDRDESGNVRRLRGAVRIVEVGRNDDGQHRVLMSYDTGSCDISVEMRLPQDLVASLGAHLFRVAELTIDIPGDSPPTMTHQI